MLKPKKSARAKKKLGINIIKLKTKKNESIIYK